MELAEAGKTSNAFGEIPSILFYLLESGGRSTPGVPGVPGTPA